MLKIIVATLLLSLGSYARTDERDLRDARLAVQRGDYAIAYCIWNSLADSNDTEALYNLGWLYHNGYGLAINDSRAIEYWKRAAEAGNADALFALGNLYRLGGEEIKRDVYKAAEYFLRAKQANHEDALEMLHVLISSPNQGLDEQLEAFIVAHADELERVIEIAVPRANFRPAPDLDTRVLRVLLLGDELVELERVGRWIRAVTLKEGQLGWLHNSLIKEEASQ